MPGGVAAPNQTDDDEDDDDPNARKPEQADLVPPEVWEEQYPRPIKLQVQVNLGADAHAANIPSVIPLEIPVRTSVLAIKQMLAPRVHAAGVTFGTMKLKDIATSFILKNSNSLAFYNVGAGGIIELTKRQRGGRR